MRNTDRWVGLGLAVLALAVLWSARAFPDVPGQKLGAAFLPTLVGAGLLLCGLALIVRSVRGRAYGAGPTPPSLPGKAQAGSADAHGRQDPVKPGDAGLEHFGSSAVIVGAVLGYIGLSERVGFLFVAPLCLMAVFLAFRVRWPVAVWCALGGTALVHVVFYKLLRVPLPWGVLTPLY